MASIFLQARTQLEWSVFALAAVHREWENGWLSPDEPQAPGNPFFTLEREGFIWRWLGRRSLRHYWGINGPSDGRARLAELLDPYAPSPNRAWDISRALDRLIHRFLTFGYLTTEDAVPYWMAAVNLATYRYRGWEHYGWDVVRAAQEWHGPGWMSDKYTPVVPRLMSNPASPWWRVPWHSLGTNHSMR